MPHCLCCGKCCTNRRFCADGCAPGVRITSDGDFVPQRKILRFFFEMEGFEDRTTGIVCDEPFESCDEMNGLTVGPSYATCTPMPASQCLVNYLRSKGFDPVLVDEDTATPTFAWAAVNDPLAGLACTEGGGYVGPVPIVCFIFECEDGRWALYVSAGSDCRVGVVELTSAGEGRPICEGIDKTITLERNTATFRIIPDDPEETECAQEAACNGEPPFGPNPECGRGESVRIMIDWELLLP